MCGIAGYWDREKRWQNHTQVLTQAARALAHRGPDAEGIWQTADARIGFIHRRLAIIDLNERSSQPMISRSKNTVLTFNGEIYNYPVLRRERSDFEWRTTSDTEVALECLEELGVRALPQFDGMFALAHYNQRLNEMLLAVDPFGKKPLYYFWDGRVFAFASEIKGLVAMGVPTEVCPDAMSEYLLFGAPFADATVYRNIHRLEGGQSLRVVDGVPSVPETYWDLPLDVLNRGSRERASSSSGANQSTEELRDLIQKATAKRLIADVPVGCFLSGGLDSSVIALEAQRSLPERNLQTFSIGFPGHPEFDESRYAESVARKIGSRHLTLASPPTSIMNADQMIAHFDEPYPDSSLLPTFALCDVVSRNVKVALSGDGGDEIFGGYRRMQAALATEQWGPLLRVFLSPVGWLGLKSSSPRSRLGFLIRLQGALKYPLARRLLEWNGYFTEESLKRHLEIRWDRIDAKISVWEERLRGCDIGQSVLYFNAKTYLFSDLLPKIDRASMFYGLEVRSPFLDKRLSEFAFRLPTKEKFSAKQTKIILKNAYRTELGTDIVDRSKKGFATPLTAIVSAWEKTRTFPGSLAQPAGDYGVLLQSQRGTTRYESCAFALRSAEINTATKIMT